MAIVVEHEKRKIEILEKSMELFCRNGYDDVTFQKIADACGITRTTLYIYFKNKHEIFNFSIKEASSKMEARFLKIIKDSSLSAENCLRLISKAAIDVCMENHSLFEILIPYLSELKRSGEDVPLRIRRRTIRINHLFNLVLIRGQKSGEFRELNIKEANEVLFALLEDFVFKMTVMGTKDTESIKSTLDFVIDSFLK